MARRAVQIGLAPIVAAMSDVDDDEVTTRILDATASLLTTYGLRRWVVEDVAERSGVGRTTVYRRFDGRDALVHAVLARELRRTLAAIAAAMAGPRRVEDKIVEGAVVAWRALEGSPVEHLLRSDPGTFLPFLTTEAGPLLALAQQTLAAQALAQGAAADAQHAAELGELAARLGLSLVLTRDTVFPVDDADAMRASVRRLLRPLVRSAAKRRRSGER